MHAVPLMRPVWRGVTLFALAAPAASQCGLEWQAGSAAPGLAGAVQALTYAPNGDLIAAGTFRVAVDVVAERIARFDGTSWHPFGAGIDGSVRALLVLPNGDVVAAGSFTSAGNAPAANIARWNGLDWFPVGSGFDGPVWELARLPNGRLVALGDFDNAGAVPARRVAVFDGTAWSGLGAGPVMSFPEQLAVLPNGNIAVGGFAPIGQPDVELWDGAAWSALNGVSSGEITGVDDLLGRADGTLAITGGINSPLNAQRLAIWNGTQLTIPPAPPFVPRNLAALPNGNLVVAGATTGPGPRVASFDGTTWTTIGNSLDGGFPTLAVGANGGLAIAQSSSSLSTILRLANGQWTPLPAGDAIVVAATAALPNGDLYAGGSFTAIDGVAAANIARHDGTTWRPLAQGLDGPVTQLAVMPDGSLLVAGDFTTAGGTPANRVARWNGASWTAIGSGPSFVPTLLAVSGGSILAARTNAAMRFDGLTWQAVQIPTGGVLRVAPAAAGEFLLGGAFVQPTGLFGLATTNGTTISAVASSNFFVPSAMLALPNGDTLISVQGGGAVATLRVFDGLGLTPFAVQPPAMVAYLALLPNGDLVGTRVNGPTASVLRFDGTSWSTLLDGIRASGTTDVLVNGLAASSRGEIAICGRFAAVGNLVSNAFARAVTPCPASVTTFGAGCVGSAGPVELATASLPWLGATVQQQASGLPSQSVAMHLVGLQTLITPLPLGAPGCLGIVDPVWTELLVPNGSTVDVQLTLPMSAALVGFTAFTQVLVFESFATTTWTRTTASNALQLTAGSF